MWWDEIWLFEGIFFVVWLVCGDLSVAILEGFGDMCLIYGDEGLIFGDTGLKLGENGLILEGCWLTLTNWLLMGDIDFCMIVEWDCKVCCLLMTDCCWVWVWFSMSWE